MDTLQHHGHPTVSQTPYIVMGTLQGQGHPTLIEFLIAYCEFNEGLLCFLHQQLFLSLIAQKLELATLKF